MAVCVIAVFLCRVDGGSGHDYATVVVVNTPSSFQCHFGAPPSSHKLASLSSNAG